MVEHLDLHNIFEIGLLLVMIAAGITAIAKKFKKTYPIALIIVGTIIGIGASEKVYYRRRNF